MAREIRAGTSDAIQMTANAAFVITGNLTWFGWLKFNSGIDTNDTFVGIWRSGESLSTNTLLQLYFPNTTTPRDNNSIHEYGTGSNEIDSFNTNFNDDTWYFVAYVRNTSDNDIDIYVDDNAPINATFTNDPANNNSTMPYTIGAIYDGTTGPLQSCEGFYSWVGIKNADDFPATTLDALGRGVNPFAFDLGLTAFHPLHGNQDPEPDYSGNGHTGDVIGATKPSDNPPVELMENYL